MIDLIASEIREIAIDFVNSIELLGNHNHFQLESSNKTTNMSRDVGFNLLYEDIENHYVVKEEQFLEGCIRVFLINPIIKKLLDYHSLQNEWYFNGTFNNFTVSNRELELGQYVQFIAVLNGEKVGVRYTPPWYTSLEFETMERDKDYIFGEKKVPGFELLSPIDSIITVDWTGALSLPNRSNVKTGPRIISVQEFFESFFSYEEYEIVIAESRKAVKKAKEIIGLRAIPQLLPNNIFGFKKSVLDDFSLWVAEDNEYEFKQETPYEGLSDADKKIVEKNYSAFCDAIIGNKEFAESFITAEYLYRSIKDNINIDYTSLAVGYLKSVEQLLYLFYLSAFEGATGLSYWDICKKKESLEAFDAEKPNYRYDPYYNEEEGKRREKQELYWHRKRIGNNALEIGGLIRFLRYYEKVWGISETGKEYICKCLNDYRQYCRNSYFHKDNIDRNNYSTVTRIRNNTRICLFYLLGAFKLLDRSVEEKQQFGITDNRLSLLYYYTHTIKRSMFRAKVDNANEKILYYKRETPDYHFNDSGELIKGTFSFIIIKSDGGLLYPSFINKLVKDEDYVRKNTICFSESFLPIEITPLEKQKNM